MHCCLESGTKTSASSFLVLDLSPLQTCLLLGLFSESIAFNETDAVCFGFLPPPANRVDIFSWFCSCCSVDNEPRCADSEARVPTLVMQPPEVTCQRRLFPDCSATLFLWKPYLIDRHEREESLSSSKSPEITSVCQSGCTHMRVCMSWASITHTELSHTLIPIF